MDAQMQWIESAAAARPALAPLLAELGELYSRRLWHQLTLKLDDVLADPAASADGAFLLDLYRSFVARFQHKLNLLKLAAFAAAVSRALPTPPEGAAFLGDVAAALLAAKQPADDPAGPVLFLRAHAAQYTLAAGDAGAAKAAVDDAVAALRGLDAPDAAVAAAVHYAAMQLHKARHEYGAFYRAALAYLGAAPAGGLPPPAARALAVDVALAALLGEDVYSFGELAAHPFVAAALAGGADAWLAEALAVFGAGDIAGYDALCARHAAALNAQPALVAHERRLREKITVMCLLELVAGLPPGERTLPLAAIAERTRLPPDGVEFLLMRAMALGLVEGSIDQVAGTATITWVAPRVLTMPQVAALRERVRAWASRVEAAAAALHEGAAGIVEA